MAKLNFNTNVTPRQSLRPIADLALGRTIGEIDVSDSSHPHLPCYPHKYLPVNVIDNVSDEGIVMVKGTIVSLLTNQTQLLSPNLPGSGIPVPTTSGTVPTGDDASTSTVGDWIRDNIDDSYFGYEQSVISLLVPANGGSASELRYSTADDTVGAYTASTLPVMQLGANMPAGVVYQDVYQDIRGLNLNYQMHDVYGIACRGFITVPFVDTNQVTFGSDADTQTATLSTTSAYYATYRKFAFFYFSSANNGGSSGQVLTSDKLGKFKPQGTGTTTAITAQSVGLLKACDSRFPKDLISTVQTYPGSQVTGTDTAGVPSMLYHFAKAVLTVTLSATPTNAQILDAIQHGKFGLARIALVLG